MPTLGLYIKEANCETQLTLKNKQEIYFMTLSQGEKLPSEITHNREHGKCRYSSVMLILKSFRHHISVMWTTAESSIGDVFENYKNIPPSAMNIQSDM